MPPAVAATQPPGPPPVWTSSRRVLAMGAVLLLCSLGPAAAQHLILEEEPPPSGVFATLGMGVVDVEAGTGFGLPLSITAVSPPKRVMASFTFYELGLLQGASGDVRYQRFYDSRFGQDVCVDTATNQVVSCAFCAADTDVLQSMALDLSILPVDKLFVGNKAGVLHAGLGLRLADPRTLYGTLGMFFPSRSGRAVAARLSMGREYIFIGFYWGIAVRRLAGWL